MHDSVLIRKSNGTLEPFDPSKLERSLRNSGADESVARTVAEEVTRSIVSGASTEQIYRRAFQLLKKRARAIAPRYHLKRALSELGPSGYPFEDYVARLFEGQGYTTKTRQVLQGACVEHEVDLVAERDGVTLGAEIKFHNSNGQKSDLKTALYVKARYDDLRVGAQPHETPLHSYWLITNTKFTEKAIAYARCAGLTLLAWNYPRDRNLEHMIQETQAHPLTCLTTLSGPHKRELLQQGHVLCNDLRAETGLLDTLGISPQTRRKVQDEVTQLCALPT